MTTQMLRIEDVIGLTTLSRSSIYAMIERQEFPRGVKIGRRATAWIPEDIENWIQERIAISRELPELMVGTRAKKKGATVSPLG
jgi:prophage regulatory protein